MIQTYPEFDRAKPLIKYIMDSEERIVPKRCIVKQKWESNIKGKC